MKSLDLPEKIHSDLLAVSQELSLMAKKTVSVPMTVSLLIEVYRAHLSNPCALDGFSMQLRNSNILSPEEFDKMWDETPTAGNIKQKRKKEKRKI
jgi:hypothetical protein